MRSVPRMELRAGPAPLVLVMALLVGVIGGVWAGVLIAPVCWYAFSSASRNRQVKLGAVLLMCLVPGVWLLDNLLLLGDLSPSLVSESPWPSRVVVLALAAASVGLVADLRQESE